MPRINATQSQSYVIGSSGSGIDRAGGSELPRFERPVIKQAKSAYSSTNSRGVHSGMSESGSKIFRGRSTSAGGSIRGGTSEDQQLPMNSSPSSGNLSSSVGHHHQRQKVRAAVGGRDAVLPDWSRSAPSPNNSFNNSHNNNRNRTTSDGYSALNNHPQHHQHQTIAMNQYNHTPDYDDSDDDNHHNMIDSQQGSASSNRALRQRKPMEDFPPTPHLVGNGHRSPRQPNRVVSGTTIPGGGPGGNGSGGSEDSPYRLHNKRGSNNKLVSHFSNVFSRICCSGRAWTVGHFFQATMVVLVTVLLYDSHHKANLIAQRLKEFKSEEAMVFLHLHRIEQQSMQLHEVLGRLDTSQLSANGKGNTKNDKVGENLDNKSQDGDSRRKKNIPAIDSALIQKQTQQLMQMEEELSHEVRTLQTRIQHSAVRSIVHEYGEGPVQVILEVVVDGETSKISILLWHDTPHAAWTWLEQISKREWDGSKIHLENNRIVNIVSNNQETEGSRLDFIERSQQRHEAWTVGLAESSGANGSGKGVNGLELFINLQDNTEFSKHNVCVGKVFDGFDVLHKIVEQSRELEQADGAPITIRSARASHLTNRETKGLI